MKQKFSLIVILALVLAGCAKLVPPGSIVTPIGPTRTPIVAPAFHVPTTVPTIEPTVLNSEPPAPLVSPLVSPLESPLASPPLNSPIATPAP
jgi:PBP1b-binding outer membrane lipoprotein LpoB